MRWPARTGQQIAQYQMTWVKIRLTGASCRCCDGIPTQPGQKQTARREGQPQRPVGASHAGPWVPVPQKELLTRENHSAASVVRPAARHQTRRAQPTWFRLKRQEGTWLGPSTRAYHLGPGANGQGGGPASHSGGVKETCAGSGQRGGEWGPHAPHPAAMPWGPLWAAERRA
jgi:hypothetical protein